MTYLICFYDGSKKKFHGKVTKRERKGEAGTISYTAYDYLLYLTRSKGTYKFKKKTPEQITRLICKDLKIKVKNIAKTKVKIKKMLSCSVYKSPKKNRNKLPDLNGR